MPMPPAVNGGHRTRLTCTRPLALAVPSIQGLRLIPGVIPVAGSQSPECPLELRTTPNGRSPLGTRRATDCPSEVPRRDRSIAEGFCSAFSREGARQEEMDQEQSGKEGGPMTIKPTERAWRIWQTEADLGLLPLSSCLFGIDLPDLPENWITFYVPGGWPLYVRRAPSDSREVFRGDGPPTVRGPLGGCVSRL